MSDSEKTGPLCREIVELVTDYLEDALGPAGDRAVQAHVAGCRGCEIYLDQMRATIAALGRISLRC